MDLVRCGYNMSYCRTKCGKHFIWGQNDDNECMTYDESHNYEDALIPHRIDDIIMEQLEDISNIFDVYPGYYSTQIIVE